MFGAVLVGGWSVACRSHFDRLEHPGRGSNRLPALEPTASSVTVTLAPAAPALPVTEAPVGHLEHPGRLAAFFARLSALETHQAKADVRIVQFGDSHTASDYGTSVARAKLAARFGGGGRGFIPMGEPYKRLFQAGEGMARGPLFDPEEAGSPKFRGSSLEGFCGPTGIAMTSRVQGAFMSTELSASADSFEIAYLAQPGGGGFDLFVDGKLRDHVSTREASRASAFRAVAVTRGSHSLTVKATGDGAVRIFGVRLDDEAVGVTLDALGVNGAKATAPLVSNAAHFKEQLAHLSPSLAILAYGTNESGDATTTTADHAAALVAVVARVREAVPTAACLVLGPPDRASAEPKLLALFAAERRAADEAGCAFYDQFTSMGGSGSIRGWSRESPPRARRDLVHLTRAGYTFLADALVSDVVSAYESSRRVTANP